MRWFRPENCFITAVPDCLDEQSFPGGWSPEVGGIEVFIFDCVIKCLDHPNECLEDFALFLFDGAVFRIEGAPKFKLRYVLDNNPIDNDFIEPVQDGECSDPALIVDGFSSAGI